jgi:hypothetical protein
MRLILDLYEFILVNGDEDRINVRNLELEEKVDDEQTNNIEESNNRCQVP